MLITLNNACFEGVNQDEVLPDHTGIPHVITRDPRLSLGGVGLLMELISRGGDFDIEEAKEAELIRRWQGLDPEDIDELLDELVSAGYIELP